MANRFLKFLVGSAAGMIVLAGLIAAGVFAVGVWRGISYQAAQKKCANAMDSYVRKEDRKRLITTGPYGSTLNGHDGYVACMHDEGH
jgi:hypothetical protein